MYDFYLSLHVLRQYETWNSECFWKLSTVLIRSLRNKTCEQSLLKSFCSHSKLAPFSYVYHHNWRYMENWWPFTNRRWLHTPLYEFVSMTGTLGKRKRQLHCDLITIIAVSTHHYPRWDVKKMHLYISTAPIHEELYSGHEIRHWKWIDLSPHCFKGMKKYNSKFQETRTVRTIGSQNFTIKVHGFIRWNGRNHSRPMSHPITAWVLSLNFMGPGFTPICLTHSSNRTNRGSLFQTCITSL